MKERESGIELLRIVAMLMIIAHHFVNNSGISHLYDYSHPSWRMFFLVVWGMWGKTAINAFVLITGYFMCEGRAFINPNHLTEDSNKLLALVIGCLMFLVFRNFKIGYHKWINLVASTAFGVLLIHAANDGMRTWLWGDLLNVPGLYVRPFGVMVAYAVLTPICVFVICSLIDYLRIRFVERPIMKKFFSS